MKEKRETKKLTSHKSQLDALKRTEKTKLLKDKKEEVN